jgi:O-antigen ligase
MISQSIPQGISERTAELVTHYLRHSVPSVRSAPYPALALASKEGIALVLGVALVVLLGVWEPLAGLAVLGVAAAVLVLMVFVRHPFVWLCTAAVALIPWFPQRNNVTKGVTGSELGLVVFYIGGLALWFVIMLLVKRRKLIRNLGDTLILGAFCVMALNALVAYSNELDMFYWVREALLFVFLLYYFPIREHCRSQRQILTLWVVFCGAMLVVGGWTLSLYLKASTNAIYAFEILSSRQNSNNNMSVVMSFFGIAGAVYARKRWQQAAMLGVAIFFVTITVVSFARAFIATTIAGIVVAFAVLDTRRLFKVAVAALVVGLVFMAGISVVFQKRSQIAIKILTSRVGSTAAGRKDVSVRARINESRVIIQSVIRSPIAGNGLASRFFYPDPINLVIARSGFVHNGYLYIIYKLGAVFWFLIYGWMVHYGLRAFFLTRAATTPLERIVGTGAFAGFVGLSAINFTSCFLEIRDGFVIVAVIVAATSMLEALQRKRLGERLSREVRTIPSERELNWLTLGWTVALACAVLAIFIWQTQ